MSCPHCPHCNQLAAIPSPEDDDGALNLMRLRAYCDETGIPILPGGFVRESDAASLMDLKPKTLKNRRSMRDPMLPLFEMRRGRAVYSLASIAQW